MAPSEPKKLRIGASGSPISKPMLEYLEGEQRKTRSRRLTRALFVSAAILLGIFGDTVNEGYAIGVTAVAAVSMMIAAVDWLVERRRTRAYAKLHASNDRTNGSAPAD